MYHLSPIIYIFLLTCFQVSGQIEVNYDETGVPPYVLPDLLKHQNTGLSIDTPADWENHRSELLGSFRQEMYGEFPDGNIDVSFIVNNSTKVFNESAWRKEVTINLENRITHENHDIHLLIYLPVSPTPVPLFLGLNYYGNHTVDEDPGITIHPAWVSNNEDFDIKNNLAGEKARGVRSNRWDMSSMLKNNYGFATMHYGEIDPDYDDNFQNGIHQLLAEDVDRSKLSSISAWAWALSQAMTYLAQDPQVASEKVVVFGHSRLGKTALWAGAQDQRFAMVISNNSGCGGAALSRRKYGETVQHINSRFTHWFCDRFNHYNGNESGLPFDQHSLLSLIAPRSLYVASAAEDRWADPLGEFLSAKFACEVYNIYGKPSIWQETMPELNTPVKKGKVGYHIRTGKHDVTDYDWQQYIQFADMQFGVE